MQPNRDPPVKLTLRNGILLILATGVLTAVYIFQRSGVLFFLSEGAGLPPNVVFIVNRTFRLILNDLACLLIIYVLFREKKYLKLSFLVFLVELFLILPLYLAVKLSLEGDSEISSPLLSQVHRLIVNPTLMLLLIIGFFYQKYLSRTI